MFPTPQLENVYSAWKPLDHGHPLVDVTIHYAPPELERVHIGAGPVPNRPPTSAGNKWVDVECRYYSDAVCRYLIAITV